MMLALEEAPIQTLPPKEAPKKTSTALYPKEPHPERKYAQRRPRRAQLLDLQDWLYAKAKRHREKTAELLPMIKAWCELEELLQTQGAGSDGGLKAPAVPSKSAQKLLHKFTEEPASPPAANPTEKAGG